MILVTGATGQFGQSAIESLIDKGTHPNDIVALVRDDNKAKKLKERGIKIAIGDYDNYQSLVNAFKKIDQLLFISGNDINKRIVQHLNVVKAAKEAKIKHIIYTSIDRKKDYDNTTLAFVLDSHKATDQAIKESGISYTLLRNNLYLDFLPLFLGENVLNDGIFLPAGEGKVGFILRSEIAEISASIALGNEHQNKEYVITGKPISFDEIATILSEISGKEIKYTSPGLDQYIDALINAGVPKDSAVMFGNFANAIKHGELDSQDILTTETLLGRKPFSVKDYLISTYQVK